MWKHLNLPAIAPEDTVISLGGRRQHRWKAGELLQPQRDSLAALERQKRDSGVERFNAQFLQAPLPEGGNMLKRDWLRTCDITPDRQPGDQAVQSWDTA